jgi:hypothetical protein
MKTLHPLLILTYVMLILSSCNVGGPMVRRKDIVSIKIFKNYDPFSGESISNSIELRSSDSIKELLSVINSATPYIVKFFAVDKLVKIIAFP